MKSHRAQFAPTASRTRQKAALKRAVDTLETAIYNNFGYQVNMGAELEYVIHCNYELPPEKRHDPFGLKDHVAKRQGYEPSRTRVHSERDTFFPGSPYVAFSYRETTHEFPVYACETVFSHQGDYGPTAPDEQHPQLQRASYLADVISSVKDVIQHGTTHRKWRDFRQKYVDDVSFSPAYAVQGESEEGSAVTNALQISSSLRRCRGGSPNRYEYLAFEPYLAEAGADGIALLGLTLQDRRRYEIKGSTIHAQFPLVEPDPASHPGIEEPCIENRLAPASCDPKLAMIVNLVGLYRGLLAQRFAKMDQPMPSRDVTNLKMEKAFDQAAERAAAPDNVIRTTLNELDFEHKLGDVVMEAALQPEKPAGQKLPHRG